MVHENEKASSGNARALVVRVQFADNQQMYRIKNILSSIEIELHNRRNKKTSLFLGYFRYDDRFQDGPGIVQRNIPN